MCFLDGVLEDVYKWTNSATPSFDKDVLPHSTGRKRPVGLKEDQTATEPEGDGFGAGRGAEFAEDGGHVEFGGVLGNFQVGCDLLVPQAAGQHLQNFFFAWSEWLE